MGAAFPEILEAAAEAAEIAEMLLDVEPIHAQILDSGAFKPPIKQI
jgi:hypothetical protein